MQAATVVINRRALRHNLTKGGYDLVTASGDASLRLIMGKRVQPINTALIPNWKTLDPRVVKGADNNALGVSHFRPDGSDLTVDQAVINAGERNVHQKSSSVVASCFQTTQVWRCSAL